MKTVIKLLELSVICALLVVSASAQLLRKSDYGVGLTVAVYQFDDVKSKQLDQVTVLKQTVNTPEEEIEHIKKTYGVEDLKIRHIRSVGLREGESFTDSQPLNDKQLSFTITPRVITKGDVSFDFTASYDGKSLLEVKGVTANSYETVMLRGGRGEFAVREFAGPNGPERVPDKRALLVTLTPAITSSRTLANKPSDLSRPTDQYGSRVELGESDTFVMPAILARAPVKFPPGAMPKGSITLEAIIAPDARVTNVRVLDTPDSAYNAKAVEAFRQYRFNPAKLNGRATYATYRETIIFNKKDPL